jgi:hypothetical protein
MSFTPRKYKEIFDEMRAMSQVVTDFEVGSVARTLYETFAFEMALLYEKMQLVYLSAYVDTARGNQLDQVVAVLGIQRSQPDFAEGIVSFKRDGAGQEIVIPIGTLVATVESAAGEKKVYQTIKEATLAATRTSVDVQIKGVERGEEFETTSDTIVVMPKPVPGIKFVNNEAPIRLVGKRRETDEELRERAKNALISSGKATILSVENTLLSLSGVRDAKVKENFHFPRAKVEISNINVVTEIIHRGTELTLNWQGTDHVFKTLDPIGYDGFDLAGTDNEVKIESILEGKIGELIGLPANTALTFTDGSLQTNFTATLKTDVKLEDFGLIEVYVDAPRMEEGTEAEKQAERTRIEAEIEKVRAAGIFSILKPAGKVETSAVFKIDVSPSLTFTPEERTEFENHVADAIMTFMGELRMGQPVLYGKLVKAILSLENIENISDFQGTATRTVLGAPLPIPFTFSHPDKFVAVDEFERIAARWISVATENKELKVHIAYHAPTLNPGSADTVKGALETWFGGMAMGDTVLKSEIQTEITNIIAIQAGSLKLLPESWSPGPEDDPRPLLEDVNGDTQVVVTYVEKPVLGILFGYANRLEITGAIKLVVPLNLTHADHTAAKAQVLDAVTDVLDHLGPEEDITFDALKAAAETVPQVLAATVEPGDFKAMLGSVNQPTLIDKKKIDVQPLQRAFFKHLAISGGTEKVALDLQSIVVNMANGTSGANQLLVQQAIANAFNNVLAGFKPGDDIVFASLKGALENLVVGLSYTIATLVIQATSEADGRIQTAQITTPADIHIRSMELADVWPTVLPADITITLLP